MSHFRLNQSVLTSAARTGRLDLHGRALHAVPDDVFNPASGLGQLQVLDLSENKLTTLPAEVRLLSSLKEINLDSNLLSTLPIELLQLPNLKAISLLDNPRLEPGLKAAFEKAAPIWRSRSRDAGPVLQWLAANAGSASSGGGGGGGGDFEDRSPPQQQRGYDDRRDDRYEEQQGQLSSPRGLDSNRYSEPRQPQYGGAGGPEEDDEYLYAQMRARAAARAAYEQSATGQPQQQQQQQPEDFARRGDSDFSSEQQYSSRDREQPPPQQQQSQQHSRSSSSSLPPAAELRFPSGAPGHNRPSPFHTDSALPMGRQEQDMSFRERQAFQQRQAAVEAQNRREAGQNPSYNTRHASSDVLNQAASTPYGNNVQQQAGRRLGNPAAPRQSPFATDNTSFASAAAPVSRSGPGYGAGPLSHRDAAVAGVRSSAPFGTDGAGGSDVPRGRRMGPQGVANRSTIASSPYAIEGGPTDDRAAPRGVRMTHKPITASAASSPFGTLPSGAAEMHYATTSSSAASHVQAAARVRAQGGLEIAMPSGEPVSPSKGRNPLSPYDDGSISGNGLRNSSYTRAAYGARPNSDVFPAREGRTDHASFERDQRFYPAANAQQGGQQQQPVAGTSSSSQLRDQDVAAGSRRFNEAGRRATGGAPFARDSDEVAPPRSSSGATQGNRANQSSVFNNDAPAPVQQSGGRGTGGGRIVKSTNLW